MMDLFWVSVAVTAGIVAFAGVPLRCWQFCSGQLRRQVPRQALAQATFSLLATLILVPNLLAWGYAVYAGCREYAGTGQPGVASAVAVGLLGCAYLLLEGFLVTARRRSVPVPGGRRRAPS